MRIRFDKIDVFIRVYDWTRYVVSFGGEKHDFICNRFRYLIGVKSGTTYAISQNDARIKVDSHYSFPPGKILLYIMLK